MSFMPRDWLSALEMSSRTVMPISWTDGNESTGVAFFFPPRSICCFHS